jgi:pimeloyl-ACP methyl ester carboxylesterase
MPRRGPSPELVSPSPDDRGTTVAARDHWIATHRGSLFARVWEPSEQHESSAAVLLFHDSLGCVSVWRDFPERLAVATGRCVVAYDRLGFGRSDPYPGRLSTTFVHDEAETMVPRLLDALRRDVELDTLVAFGHSVGGGMAVATAAVLGGVCTALITESAQSFVEDRTRSGVRAAREAFRQPGQIERLARYHGEKASWVLDAWTETWLDPGFADWTLDGDLQGVYCPTLALHGDDDEYGSTRHPERIVALVRGPSRAVILPGCGHRPHREQPRRVLDEVAQFLMPRDGIPF